MKSPAILILSLILLATCAEDDDGPDSVYGVWGYELDKERAQLASTM